MKWSLFSDLYAAMLLYMIYHPKFTEFSRLRQLSCMQAGSMYEVPAVSAGEKEGNKEIKKEITVWQVGYIMF